VFHFEKQPPPLCLPHVWKAPPKAALKNPTAGHLASRMGFFTNLPTSPFPGLDPAVGGAFPRIRAGVVATDRVHQPAERP
jgi:hypothetical protein